MDLSSPLRSIAPSLDSAVLEILAGTESAMGASRIASLSKRGTRAGQLPVLNRLVDHGLVLAEPANQGFLYRLNRDHVLASAILAAVDARAEIMRRLTAAIEALRPEPVHASMFGSFARREAHEESDIDLLVIVAEDTDEHASSWTDQMRRLEEEVLLWTGNRLECVTLTHSRLADVANAGEHIVSRWIDEGATLHGPDIADLTRPTHKRGPKARTR